MKLSRLSKILTIIVLISAVILSYEYFGDRNAEFKNKGLKKAINDYLLTQNYFSWKNQMNSRNYCAVENLDPGHESFPVYVWALCEELTMENGELKIVSGSSGPVKINYSGSSEDYDLNKFSFEAPSDGSGYPDDVRKIFPLNVQLRIRAHDVSSLESKLHNIAREELVNSGGDVDIFKTDFKSANPFINL